MTEPRHGFQHGDALRLREGPAVAFRYIDDARELVGSRRTTDTVGNPRRTPIYSRTGELVVRAVNGGAYLLARPDHCALVHDTEFCPECGCLDCAGCS